MEIFKKEPKDWLTVVCIKWRYMIIITKRAFNNASYKKIRYSCPLPTVRI